MPGNENIHLISRLLRRLSFHVFFLTIALLLLIGALVQWFASGEATILRFSIAWIIAALVIPVIVSRTVDPPADKADIAIPHKRYIQLTGAHLGFALTEVLSALILVGVFSLFGEQSIHRSTTLILFTTLILSSLISFITAQSQVKSAQLIIQKHGDSGRELFNLRSLAIVHTGAMILTCAPLFLLILPSIPITSLLAIPGAISGIISLFLLSLLGTFKKPTTDAHSSSDNHTSASNNNISQRKPITQAQLISLSEILQQRLNLEDIHTLCFHLEIDYEELEGQTKSNKIITLLKYLHRRERLDDLYRLLIQQRPDIDLGEYFARI